MVHCPGTYSCQGAAGHRRVEAAGVQRGKQAPDYQAAGRMMAGRQLLSEAPPSCFAVPAQGSFAAQNQWDAARRRSCGSSEKEGFPAQTPPPNPLILEAGFERHSDPTHGGNLAWLNLRTVLGLRQT